MALSPSRYSLLLECPRKWWYKYVEERVIPPTEAMEEGLRMDEWLTAYYKKEAVATTPFQKAYARHDPFGACEILKVQVENEVGRPDMVVRDERGTTWVVDHKVTTQQPDIWAVQNCPQFIRYVEAENADGFILNWIKRGVEPDAPKLLKNGSLSTDKRQDVDWEQCPQTEDWLWVLDREASWFQTVRILVGEEDKRRCREDLDYAERLVWFYTSQGKPPPRPNSYGFKSPCKGCYFQNLCGGGYDDKV